MKEIETDCGICKNYNDETKFCRLHGIPVKIKMQACEYFEPKEIYAMLGVKRLSR